jgi:hypothetical protein
MLGFQSFIFWDISHVAHLKSTYVSEKHIVFIFRVEKAKEDTSMKAGG